MDFLSTDKAPAAVGPYSQAVTVNGFLYSAGQVGLEPASGKMREGVEAQTRQVLDNLRGVLGAAGVDLDAVVKTTIFVADIGDYQAINGIYAEAFGDHRPARSLVQAAALPLGALVEIEVVAAL